MVKIIFGLFVYEDSFCYNYDFLKNIWNYVKFLVNVRNKIFINSY